MDPAPLLALALVVGFLLNDLLLWLSGDQTVSRWVYEASRRHRWLPWLYVVLTVFLFGHFFISWWPL